MRAMISQVYVEVRHNKTYTATRGIVLSCVQHSFSDLRRNVGVGRPSIPSEEGGDRTDDCIDDSEADGYTTQQSLSYRSDGINFGCQSNFGLSVVSG